MTRVLLLGGTGDALRIARQLAARDVYSLAGLGKVTYNVIMQIQGNPATLNSTFGGTDAGGNVISPSNSFTLTPAPPTSTTDLQLNGSASNGGPTVTGVVGGAPYAFTWKVKNNTSTTANAVVFSNTMPRSLKFDSVSLSPAGLGTCTAPAAGTGSGRCRT